MMTNYVANSGLLTEDQARKILAPYMDGLIGDFQDAWSWVQALLDGDPERRLTFDSSTQAAMVFNRFVILNTRRFDGDAKVRVKKLGRMMTINFGDGLLLRFKKFDAKLRSHNVKTNSQASIYYQLSIEGMDPATRVTFGYKTDATGRNLAGTYITCPVGWSQNKWVIPIREAEAGDLIFASPEPRDPATDDVGFAFVPINSQNKKSEGQ